jgi:hypothetical protein
MSALPPKATSNATYGMSAKGQKRTSGDAIMQLVANEKAGRKFSLKGTQVASGSIPLIDLELARASDLREAAKTSVMHLID